MPDSLSPSSYVRKIPMWIAEGNKSADLARATGHQAEDRYRGEWFTGKHSRPG